MSITERIIPSWGTGLIAEAIDKVNRKAARLGAPAFKVEFSAPYFAKITTPDGEPKTVERVKVTVTGEPLVIPNFRFLGRVDFEDGMTIVNARPGETIPTRYRSATSYCDHCASDRKRNAVYIFRRDGGEQHVQVGRTCLKDFLGHDPAAVLNAANLDVILGEALDEAEGRMGGREEIFVDLDACLAMAVAVIRHNHGAFVSKAASEKTDGRVPPTSQEVHDQLFPPRQKPRNWVTITPSEEETQCARDAKAWCLETMTDDDNDYQHNLRQLVGNELIRIRRMGLAVSLVGVYMRHLGELAQRAKQVNAYVGEVGKRREFVAKLAGVNSFDTNYGRLYIGRFATDEGLVVYKGGSPFWPSDLRDGDEIRFVATVKQHDDYKGTKQTIVQRAKVVEPVTA